MKKISGLFFLSFLICLLLSMPRAAFPAQFCIDITEEDDALIEFTDEKGWNESMGISRLTFARDKIMEFLIAPIANRNSSPRKNKAMIEIEDEERQKAAMKLAPKVKISNN